MRKFFLAVVLIFAFFALLPVLPAFSSGFERPWQFVEAGTGYVAAKNVEREFNPFNLSYGIKAKSQDITWKYDALAAVQFSNKIFDFTLCGDYFVPYTSWKMENAQIDLGANIIYHFQRYYGLYTEHDFYLESVFRFSTHNRFIFLANLGSGVKAAFVDVLQRGALLDFTFSGSVAASYCFDSGAELYSGIVSHELFRFPLAYTPTNFFGFAWNFKNGLRISSDIGIRLHDWFVVAPYIDRYEWNIKARFTF